VSCVCNTCSIDVYVCICMYVCVCVCVCACENLRLYYVFSCGRPSLCLMNDVCDGFACSLPCGCIVCACVCDCMCLRNCRSTYVRLFSPGLCCPAQCL
jgi:hypothetical protein